MTRNGAIAGSSPGAGFAPLVPPPQMTRIPGFSLRRPHQGGIGLVAQRERTRLKSGHVPVRVRASPSGGRVPPTGDPTMTEDNPDVEDHLQKTVPDDGMQLLEPGQDPEQYLDHVVWPRLDALLDVLEDTTPVAEWLRDYADDIEEGEA